MPTRRLFAYWLMILLPALAIGGLALHYIRHEKDLLAAQQRASLSEQGRRAAEDILLLVENLQNGLVLSLESLPDERRVESLRALRRTDPLVRQVFLFDSPAQRVVIPDADELRRPETQAFVKRYDALFTGRVPWFPGEPPAPARREALAEAPPPAESAVVAGGTFADAAPAPASGGAPVETAWDGLPPFANEPGPNVIVVQIDENAPAGDAPAPVLSQAAAPPSKRVDLANSGKGNLFRQIWSEYGQNKQVRAAEAVPLGADADARLAGAAPEGAAYRENADAPADGAGTEPLALLQQTAETPAPPAAERLRASVGAAQFAGTVMATPAAPVAPQEFYAMEEQEPEGLSLRLSARLPGTPAPGRDQGGGLVGGQLREEPRPAAKPAPAAGKMDEVDRLSQAAAKPRAKAAGQDADDAPVAVSRPLLLPTLRHGWRPWYWENDFHLLGFVQDAVRGETFGVELELLALLSRLPAALEGGATAAFVLRDQLGSTYFQSRPVDARETPVDVFNLAPSLAFYELAVFPADPAAAAGLARTGFLAMALLVGAFLVSIASGGGLLIAHARSSWREAMRKTSFVSNVSHELKTPLTTLRMYTEMLRSGRVPEEKRAQYLDVMLTEGERLSRLVGNVLDFSRLEQGQKKYRLERIDLGAFAGRVVEASRVAFERPDLCLTFVPPETPVSVRADTDALEQILLNLMDNAAKYASAGGEIRVTAGRHGRLARLSVLDRGPGVPPEHRQRVFEKFHRVDDSLTAAQGGCGLGLSIARRLARDHGGDITCAERPGGGAAFHLDLPAAEESGS